MIRKGIYCLLISFVLLTPFMFSDELYNGIVSAKQIWFYFGVGLLIFFYGAENLFIKKNAELRLNWIDISLLVFYLYFFMRTCYTPYTPAIHNQKFLNYTLLVLFYFILKDTCTAYIGKTGIKEENGQKDYSLIGIIALVLMLTGFIEAIWGLMQLYGFTRSFHSGFKITGTFVNPAPYALYLAAIFPVALHFVMNELRNEKIKELDDETPLSFIPSFLHFLIKKVSLLTMISILLVLPATMNRASWIGVIASSFFVFNYRYELNNKLYEGLKSRKRRITAFAGILVILVLVGIGLYHLKAGSSFGRRFIWEVTAGKIAEKPLFGYGVGRFEAEYNNWQAEYFKYHSEEMDGPKGMAAGNTKYCYNEYLEMASETGIIGLGLFLGMIFVVFYAATRRIHQRENSSFSVLGSFIFSFISILFCALVSFPFYSLPTLIVFVLVLGVLSSWIKGKVLFNQSGNSYFSNSLLVKPICFFLLPLSVLLLNRVAQQYKVCKKWEEANYYYQNSMYKESCQSFSEIYKPLLFNGYYLQSYGKAMYMNEKYTQGLELQQKAAEFTSDEILYTTQGDTYKALKKYLKAEEVYQHASLMAPCMLYPKYLLANLYDETGQNGKAIRIAEELLSQKVKIGSAATDEISLAMQKLIKKLDTSAEDFEKNGTQN